jgi:hypothetical protein
MIALDQLGSLSIDTYTVGANGKRRKMLLIPANRIDTWIMDIELRRVCLGPEDEIQ